MFRCEKSIYMDRWEREIRLDYLSNGVLYSMSNFMKLLILWRRG